MKGKGGCEADQNPRAKLQKTMKKREPKATLMKNAFFTPSHLAFLSRAPYLS